MRRRALLGTITVVWAAAVVAGMGLLMNFKNTPGAAAAGLEAWPARSKLERSARVPTLVMFAHPRCICTRASMSELATLLGTSRGKVETRVVFMKPSETEPGWERSDTWAAASALANTKLSVDIDGSEARLFGARTSGQVLLFGVDGQLLFSGGITGSRGHVGDNAGRRRIEAILKNVPIDQRVSPVFGCALTSEQESTR